MHIRIADVDFLIASESLPLEFKNHLSAHTPFLTDTSDIDALTDNINITCFLNSFPPTDSFQKIFQAEDSWSMLKDGEEYFLEIGSGSKETVCMARFDRQVRQVTVYCGNALLDNVNGRKKLINPFSYPLDQLLFMYAMAEREGILVHASSVLINGRGYLFAGRSGAGKSTISNCFKLAGYEILNDDRIAIRRIGDRFRVFGTPWPGEADIAVNNSASLCGIFFIKHGIENRATRLASREAIERLMPVTSIPWYDRDIIPSVLSLCEDLGFNIPAYELQFKPGREVIEFLEEFVPEV